jgi:hypothetical protein
MHEHLLSEHKAEDSNFDENNDVDFVLEKEEVKKVDDTEN